MTLLVLASASASRAKILRDAGVAFDMVPSRVNEDAVKMMGFSPHDVAQRLAEVKASTVASGHPDRLVLGADQVLNLDGKVLSKAATRETAADQLKALRGRAHVLISALALMRDGEVVWRHTDEARLTMRDFSDAFLEAYLGAEGDAVLGSVGCYRLEGLGAQLFERVEGDYFSILGLPLVPLLGALRDFGVVAR
ncbi:MAG TPA: nucleoside triphosphate pyrophosphatase [Rhizomicrobium sp.]|nr:nucleoside triphosphate pyrophosphatase [Rhizomicrobium sp.]